MACHLKLGRQGLAGSSLDFWIFCEHLGLLDDLTGRFAKQFHNIERPRLADTADVADAWSHWPPGAG